MGQQVEHVVVLMVHMQLLDNINNCYILGCASPHPVTGLWSISGLKGTAIESHESLYSHKQGLASFDLQIL